MAQEDGSIRIVAKITTKDAEESLSSLEYTIKKSAKEIDKLRQKMDTLKDQKVPTQEYKNLQEELAKAEKEFSNIFERIKDIEKSGMKAPSGLYDELDKAGEKVGELELKIADLKEVGKDFVLGQDTAEYAAVSWQIEYEEETIAKAGEHYKKLASDEERLLEIKKNSTITDQKMVDLLEQRDQLAKKLTELSEAGVGYGYEEYNQAYIAWKNATDAVKAYQAELNKQTASGQEKAAAQAAKEAERQEAAQRRIEEQAEKALQKENARIQKEIENQEKLGAKETERRAKLEAEAAEEERLAQIRENAVVGNQRIVESLDRIKQLEQEIADLKKAGVTEGYEDYDRRIHELSGLKQEVKDYNSDIEKTKESYKKLGDAAKESFDKVNKSVRETNGFLGKMGSKIKNIALGFLIFNQVRKAFQAMSNAIKEGFGNLYSESESFKNSVDGLKSSALTMKNSFAAAFLPLAEIAIPYIQKAVEWLTRLADAFGQFVAAVSGQKTYTKAVEQTTDALEGESKAQNKQLSGLDKLNNLSSDDEGGGGGGGVGQMFEQIPVDTGVLEFLQMVQEFLAPIIEYAERLKDIFLEGFSGGLKNFDPMVESIKESVLSIKDSLVGIWTDPEVTSSADRWAQSLAGMLGAAASSAASIGLTIATNLFGGIERYLSSNQERIKGFLVSVFDIGTEIDNMLSGLFGAIAYVFEAFASKNGQQLTASLIGIFVDAFMGVSEVAGKLAEDILNIFIRPFVDNQEGFKTALDGFLGILAEVAGTIKDSIDETFDKLIEIYDEHFKPFFDSIATGLSEVVEHFLEFWNGYVQPVLEEWAAKFDELWKTHIQPLINGFIELMGSVADALKVFWEEILKPLIDWIIENILPVLLPILDSVYNTVVDVVGGIADAISGIISALKGVIDFIIGVFTGNWEKAFGGIRTIVEGVMKAIKGSIATVMSTIGGIVRTVLTAIGAFFETIFKGVAGFVQTIFGRIKSTFSAGLNAIKSAWSNAWTGMKTTVVSIFNGIWSAIKGAINSIIGGIEGMANGVINGINFMIRALNKIHFDIPSWVPGLGGKSFGFNITELSKVSIPRLATGTVVPPNREFMAVLGDNKREPEVVSPLSTMKQAMLEALEESGRVGWAKEVTVRVPVEIDGKVLFELIKKLDLEQYRRTQRPSFQM